MHFVAVLSALAASAIALPHADVVVAPRQDAGNANPPTTGIVVSWTAPDTSSTSITTTTTTLGLLPTSSTSVTTTTTTLGQAFTSPSTTTTTTTTLGSNWQTWTSAASTPTAQAEWGGGFGTSCSTPGAYHCMPATDGSTYGTAVGVCSVVKLIVQHTPCASGTVCKSRTPSDTSIYCVPPEFQFCQGDQLPPANGTAAFKHKRDSTEPCFA